MHETETSQAEDDEQDDLEEEEDEEDLADGEEAFHDARIEILLFHFLAPSGAFKPKEYGRRSPRPACLLDCSKGIDTWVWISLGLSLKCPDLLLLDYWGSHFTCSPVPRRFEGWDASLLGLASLCCAT